MNHLLDDCGALVLRAMDHAAMVFITKDRGLGGDGQFLIGFTWISVK